VFREILQVRVNESVGKADGKMLKFVELLSAKLIYSVKRTHYNTAILYKKAKLFLCTL
jgi:hypothetical protein